MAQIWRDPELSTEPLAGKTVSILGFGSQGRAQAMNARDSGLDVLVGARSAGTSEEEARRAGFSPVTLEDAVAEGDLIALLLPERAHTSVLDQVVNPGAKDGAAVVFAHGYTIMYGTVKPRDGLQRLLVAPKAIGPQLRNLYVGGSGAAALVAAEPGDIDLAKAYAKALGCGRRAVIESSFREETETDLFGEQAVLCGGIPSIAIAAFETLVGAGYSPEAAFYECLFEIKLIADMMIENGVAGMVDRISDTAQYGAMVAGPRVVDKRLREVFEALLDDIRSGRFATEASSPLASERVQTWRETLRRHLIEETRAKLEQDH